ncbi:uncharacterized protein LOC134180112 [Corticium candelabrum]|uniref:uncharacterized protein LOC134180112 n=1 Tax=Corticium candelabrum TaxID=121492 RepID=UPI002E267D12|nr:uncharacterized protein LOC134180112 [Corticium candelabrum]
MASKHVSYLKRVNNQCLRLEIKIMGRLLYRNKNQHRREKEFQKLQKLHKLAKRVSDSPAIDTINKLLKQMIKHLVNKSDSDITEENLTKVLADFTSYAELIKHAISFCQDAYCGIARQLSMAWFVPFTLTMVAAISRIWICLRFILLKVNEIERAVRKMAQQLDIVIRQASGAPTVTHEDSQQIIMSPLVLHATVDHDVMFAEMHLTERDWSRERHSEEDVCSDTAKVDIGEPIAIDWTIDSDNDKRRKRTMKQKGSASNKRRGEHAIPVSKRKRQSSKKDFKPIQYCHKDCESGKTVETIDGHNKEVECLPETTKCGMSSDTIDDIFSVLDSP